MIFDPFKFIKACFMDLYMVYPGECTTCTWEKNVHSIVGWNVV